MIDEKRLIILDEGVPVEVTDVLGSTVTTKALIGKATKQFFTEIAFEYHRVGIFVPELNVTNGCRILNTVTGESYLTLANMEEIIRGQKASTVARMVECNTSINVKTLGETADEFGNITNEDIVKYSDLKAYVEKVRDELKQYDAGLQPEAKYYLYAPAVEINILDKIEMNINGKVLPLKVDAVDYISFPGNVIVTVCTETRV